MTAPFRCCGALRSSQQRSISSVRSSSVDFPEHIQDWKNVSFQRNFLDYASQHLNVHTQDDWYKVSFKDIVSLGGAPLRRIYKNSMYNTLVSVYPNQDWPIWKFNRVPSGQWDDLNQQRQFMDMAAQKLGLKSMDDWYYVKQSQIKQLGGGSLLQHYYHNSLSAALMQIYPNHKWNIELFKVPNGYWDNTENVRRFLEQFLNHDSSATSHEDFYNLSVSKIYEKGGRGLLSKYGFSLYNLLEHAYPEHSWDGWKFKPVPKGYWNKQENVMKYVKWFQEQYGISKLSDWNTVSVEQIINTGGKGLLSKYGGLAGLLSSVYPQHNWNASLKTFPSKSQTRLFKVLQTLFPNSTTTMNVKIPGALHSNTNREIEIDVLVKLDSLSLAFEYQGEQHFMWSPIYGDHSIQRDVYKDKEEGCKQSGVSLVAVPYWWDRSPVSLAATILKAVPHAAPHLNTSLLTKSLPRDNTSENITQTIQPYAIPAHPSTPTHEGVGKELSHQSVKLGLPQSLPYLPGTDATGWLVLPNYEGVKLFWDGNNSLTTLNGVAAQLPNEVMQTLKSFPFPVEAVFICSDSQWFHECYDMVTSKREISKESQWKLVILDAPFHTNLSYEKRLQLLKQHPSSTPKMEIASPVICQGAAHLESIFQQLQQQGYNGVIMKDPKSLYLMPKSVYHLRVHEHKEAVLISIDPVNQKAICQSESHPFQVSIPLELIPHLRVGSVVRVTSTPEPSILQILPDITPELLLEKNALYWITEGDRVGKTPKCISCYHPFRNRTELRVDCWGSFSPPARGTHLTKYSLCIQPKCLERVLKMHPYQLKGVFLPMLEKIGIPHRMKEPAKALMDNSNPKSKELDKFFKEHEIDVVSFVVSE